MEMKPETRDRLRKVSVATLCTQLYKRGFRNVYIQGTSRLTKPSIGNLVGPAFTMRSIPSREDLDQLSAFDDPNHPQRRRSRAFPRDTCWCSTAAARSAWPPAGRSSPRGS